MNSNQFPDHWKSKPLKEIARVITGKTPPTKNSSCWNGSIPFITPGELKGNAVITSERTITEEGLKFVKALPYGTVLVSCIGYIGKVGVVETPIAVTNQQINSAIPKEGILDNWYLAYAFIFLEPFFKDLAGITTVPILNKSSFELINIPLPPLSEQRAIARVLRTVQAAREARLREIALERERKAALMEHLFTHGTRGEPTKMTEIGEMPESWSAIQLDKACIKIVDCPHSTPHFSSAGVLVVRNFNIRNGRLDLKSAFYIKEEEYIERIRRCEPDEGDILFSREAPVGEACLVPPDIRLCLGQRMMLLRVDTSMLDRFFLVQAFYSSAIRSIMMSISSGVTAKHLNVADVKRLWIPFPSTEEQGQISEILSACDSKISTLDHEASLLDELFRTLLEELMSGKLPAKGLIEP